VIDLVEYLIHRGQIVQVVGGLHCPHSQRQMTCGATTANHMLDDGHPYAILFVRRAVDRRSARKRSSSRSWSSRAQREPAACNCGWGFGKARRALWLAAFPPRAQASESDLKSHGPKNVRRAQLRRVGCRVGLCCSARKLEERYDPKRHSRITVEPRREGFFASGTTAGGFGAAAGLGSSG